MEVREHCEQIDRCNQRGGRMLSVVDLIEADTISIDLAAYALAAISRGASFLVGALPGGAGKTTVMGAFLNFVPPDVELVAADGLATIEQAKLQTQRCCLICHEISRGAYYAYLWGRPLRAYFELADSGHMLATNLHADTYPQAYEQICGDNGVSEQALRKVNLMFFLSVQRSGLSTYRRIEEVWESDSLNEHQRIFSADSPSSAIQSSRLVPPENLVPAGRLIDHLLASGLRRIEQVRAKITEQFRAL